MNSRTRQIEEEMLALKKRQKELQSLLREQNSLAAQEARKKERRNLISQIRLLCKDQQGFAWKYHKETVSGSFSEGSDLDEFCIHISDTWHTLVEIDDSKIRVQITLPTSTKEAVCHIKAHSPHLGRWLQRKEPIKESAPDVLCAQAELWVFKQMQHKALEWEKKYLS